MLYPENFEEKIGFNSMRSLLAERCKSSLGGEEVATMSFSNDYDEVMLRLHRSRSMLQLLLDKREDLPAEAFYDLREALSRLRVEGLFFDETELFDLRRALYASRKWQHFLQSDDSELYSGLKDLPADLPDFLPLIKRIDGVLDKFGRIRDDASPQLARIRREMLSVQASVSRSLNIILRQAQADGYVPQDAAPVLREGRLMIPVSPSFKRKISGIVHDESASGKTVFMEPATVVAANNRIRELQGEESRELNRILGELTDFLRPHFDDIRASQCFLGQVDFLRAKALLAHEVKAICPRVDNCCRVEWERAQHPLLYLSLRKQAKAIIPLDISLNEKQRILIISGPNAGGKSVCLKTVALLQYMLQCGMPIPLHENSRCGIFQRIFIDIGDEQSIENDLSTYSSHLLNMKFFIRNGNARSLLLIDEFGSGTEPNIGGAIAEATLERFNRKKMFGLITTHYSNLKQYAEEHEGILNAAMLYDRQHLQPLFRLEIGRPGSSFAVEIARKIGLPEDLITEAAEKVGNTQMDYDKYLQDLLRDKRYWEDKRRQIRKEEKRLEETLANYERALEDINRSRKEIIRQAKTEAGQILSGANAQIENTIHRIKKSQAEKESTRQAREALQHFKEKLDALPESDRNQPPLKAIKSKHSQSSIRKPNPPAQAPEWKSGMAVILKGQTAVGQIIRIQGQNAVVAFGSLKSTLKLEQLEAVSFSRLKKEQSQLPAAALGARASDDLLRRKQSFRNEIDLRGMRGDEALQALIYFIDDAVVVGAPIVRILHGTGSGALRHLIRQTLPTLTVVRSFRDEHIQLGGAGVTVVELL